VFSARIGAPKNRSPPSSFLTTAMPLLVFSATTQKRRDGSPTGSFPPSRPFRKVRPVVDSNFTSESFIPSDYKDRTSVLLSNPLLNPLLIRLFKLHRLKNHVRAYSNRLVQSSKIAHCLVYRFGRSNRRIPGWAALPIDQPKGLVLLSGGRCLILKAENPFFDVGDGRRRFSA
jgi:hypothetical protein